MKSLRESLAAGFFKRIEKELGRETTLRLLWPYVVGPRLAGNTGLKAIRGAMLIVSVPDRGWLGSLQSLDRMILDAANRLGSEKAYDAIEFVIEFSEFAGQPQRTPPPEETQPGPLPGVRQLPAVELGTGPITDGHMRKLFLESAGKYFSAQEGRRS